MNSYCLSGGGVQLQPKDWVETASAEESTFTNSDESKPAVQLKPVERHQAAKQWVERARDEEQEDLWQGMEEMRHWYRAVKRRLDYVDEDVCLNLSEEQQQEIEKYKERYLTITQELSQNSFPDTGEIKIQTKRLRIIHAGTKKVISAWLSGKRAVARERVSPPAKPDGSKRKIFTRSDAAPKVGNYYGSLMNTPYKKCLGMELRTHQNEGALVNIEKELKLAFWSDEFAEDDIYVGMPTGSGKTRVIAATIALAIYRQMVNFKKGDKIFITAHRSMITDQNFNKIQELIDGLFMERFGRLPKLTVYDGRSHVLSGDIVFVSIPSASHPKSTFWAELNREMDSKPKGASIPLCFIDEVHHDLAPTWVVFKEQFREFNRKRQKLCAVVGVSGSLRRDQVATAVVNQSLEENIRKKVLPEVCVSRNKTPFLLTNLKTAKKKKSGEVDFTAKSLSLSINTPERNRYIMEKLHEQGFRNEAKNGLLPTLGFGVDVAHADAMADEHVSYFGVNLERYEEVKARYRAELIRDHAGLSDKEVELRSVALAKARFMKEDEDPIMGRIIAKIDHKITLKELENLIARKQKGEIDALVAVVSGSTRGRVFNRIIEIAEEGLIEGVYNCKKLDEGFNGWWLGNVILKPTLSIIEKIQQLGRLLRRGPDEVSKYGRLLKIPPRLVLDFIDSGNYAFIEAADLLGFSRYLLEGGVAYSASTKKTLSRTSYVKAKRRKTKPVILPDGSVTQYGGYSLVLQEILESKYLGSVEELAFDLGLDDTGVRLLLDESTLLSWEEVYEIERLLYLRKGEILGKATLAKIGKEEVSVQAIDVLLDSVKLYLSREDLPWDDFELSVTIGEDENKINVKKSTLNSLAKRKSFNRYHISLARSLYYYFSNHAQDSDSVIDFAGARDRLRDAMNLFAEQIGGSELGHAVLSGQLFWDKSVHGAHEVSARQLEEERRTFLYRTYVKYHPEVTEPPKVLYVYTGRGGINNNSIVKGLHVVDEAELGQFLEKSKYPTYIKLIYNEEKGCYELISRKSDTRGPMSEEVFYLLNDLGWAGSKREISLNERKLRQLTRVELETIVGNEEALSLFKEIVSEKVTDKQREVYLIAGSQGLHREKVSVGFTVLSSVEFEEWEDKDNVLFPYVKLRVSPGGKITVRNIATDLRCNSRVLIDRIVPTLIRADWFTVADINYHHLRLEQATRIKPGDLAGSREAKKLLKRMLNYYRRKGHTALYLTAGAQGVAKGVISKGLRVRTEAEASKYMNDHPERFMLKITNIPGGNNWSLNSKKDYRGSSSPEIVQALISAKLLIPLIEWPPKKGKSHGDVREVYDPQGDEKAAFVNAQDVLNESLLFYLADKELNSHEVTINYVIGGDKNLFNVSRYIKSSIKKHGLGRTTVMTLASALYYVFSTESSDEYRQRRTALVEAMNSWTGLYYDRLSPLSGVGDQHLWDITKQALREMNERIPPLDRPQYLLRQYQKKHKDKPETVYVVVDANNGFAGDKVTGKIRIVNKDEYEEIQRKYTNANSIAVLECKVLEGGFLEIVDRVKDVHGKSSGHFFKAMLELGWVKESARSVFRTKTTGDSKFFKDVAMKDLFLSIINQMKEKESEVYLVSGRVTKEHAHTGIRVLTKNEYDKLVKEGKINNSSFTTVILQIGGDKPKVVTGKHAFGCSPLVLTRHLVENKWVESTIPDAKHVRLVGGEKVESASESYEQFLETASSLNQDKIYIIFTHDSSDTNRPAKGVRVMNEADFRKTLAARDADRISYIELDKDSDDGKWHLKSYRGHNVRHTNTFFQYAIKNNWFVYDLCSLEDLEFQEFTRTASMAEIRAGKKDLAAKLQRRFSEKDEDELYLVGSTNGYNKDGRMTSGLLLLTREEYEVWKAGLTDVNRHPCLLLRRDESGKIVVTDEKQLSSGRGTLPLFKFLCEIGAITSTLLESRIEILKNIPDDNALEVLHENQEFIADLKAKLEGIEGDEIYIVNGSNQVVSKKLEKPLRIMGPEEFKQYMQTVKQKYRYARIRVVRDDEKYIIQSLDDVEGKMAFEIMQMLLKTDLFEFADGSLLEDDSFKRATAPLMIDNVAAFRELLAPFKSIIDRKKIAGENLYLLFGAHGLRKSGKMSGGIQVLTEAELQAWKIEKGEGSRNYPYFTIDPFNLKGDAIQFIANTNKRVNAERIAATLKQAGWLY